MRPLYVLPLALLSGCGVASSLAVLIGAGDGGGGAPEPDTGFTTHLSRSSFVLQPGESERFDILIEPVDPSDPSFDISFDTGEGVAVTGFSFDSETRAHAYIHADDDAEAAAGELVVHVIGSGTASGESVSTAGYRVIDDLSAGTPVDLEIVTRVLGVQQSPSWMAYRDGDGPWQPLASGSQGQHTASIVSPRFGLAVVCARTNPNYPTERDADVQVLEGDVADFDGAPIEFDCDYGDGVSTVDITGFVTGSAGDSVRVTTDRGTTFTSPFASYTVPARNGSRDLYAFRTPLAGPPDMAVLVRDFDPQAEPTQDLDFLGSGTPMTPKSVTIDNAPTTPGVTAGAFLLSDQGTRATLVDPMTVAGAGILVTYPGFLEDDERYELLVENAVSGTNGVTAFSLKRHFLQSTFPPNAPAIPAPQQPVASVDTGGGGIAGLRASFVAAPGHVRVTFDHSLLVVHRFTLHRGEHADSDPIVEIPPLDTVAGWDPLWEPGPGMIQYEASSITTFSPFPAALVRDRVEGRRVLDSSYSEDGIRGSIFVP